jgi:hypothetical protein
MSHSCERLIHRPTVLHARQSPGRLSRMRATELRLAFSGNSVHAPRDSESVHAPRESNGVHAPRQNKKESMRCCALSLSKKRTHRQVLSRAAAQVSKWHQMHRLHTPRRNCPQAPAPRLETKAPRTTTNLKECLRHAARSRTQHRAVLSRRAAYACMASQSATRRRSRARTG